MDNRLWFSDWYGGLCFTCGFLLFAAAVTILFLRRQKPWSLRKRMMIVSAIIILSGVLGIGISSVLIHITQQSLIAPHVQQALDKTFGSQKYVATDGEFYYESGFYWRSSDHSVQCFDGAEWICSYSNK